MKKKLEIFKLFDGTANFYNPSLANRFNNTNLNPQGSGYAHQYGHGGNSALRKATRAIIYDSSPQQYLDLAILGMKTPVQKDSDEFFYHEVGFGREAIISQAIPAPIASATSQSIPIQNKESVSLDMIVVYPDNSRGTITAINPAGIGAIITVTSETNESLPAIPAGAAGSFILANLAPVEADAQSSISQYVRYDTIERTNYVQMLVKAMRFGKMELFKLNRTNQLSNYMEMQKRKMYQQFKISLSNIYWNGKKGEVTLANGDKAKTADGIFPIMQKAGSANISVSLSSSPSALEELALSTEFGVYGQKRFAYATPRVIHYISQQYKRNLTRYAPNNMVAELGLEMVKMGSTEIVFVPIKRFEEPSCFPSQFRSKLFLIDQESITPCYVLPEETGETLPRKNGGTTNNYVDTWIAATHSIEFNNPLGCGWLDITDLP